MAERSVFLVMQEAGGGQGPLPSEEQRWVGAEDAGLLPMVFFCAGCKRPVGDTLSWVTNDEETGCILLSRATDIVLVDEERQFSEFPGERGWEPRGPGYGAKEKPDRVRQVLPKAGGQVYQCSPRGRARKLGPEYFVSVVYTNMTQALLCSGCSMTLGNIYRCTPKHLDYKKDLFCFSVDSVESYILGSAEKKAAAAEEPVTLANRAVLEGEAQRIQTAVSALETRLIAVELRMASLCSKFGKKFHAGRFN